ncbi:MAG: hypothetical protein ACK56F_00955, partial [bacterium]
MGHAPTRCPVAERSGRAAERGEDDGQVHAVDGAVEVAVAGGRVLQAPPTEDDARIGTVDDAVQVHV